MTMLKCFRRRNAVPVQRSAEKPFPYRQLTILALCRICEPIAFMSIFPYVYHMVASFDITTDTHRLAIYAGMVTSAFTFAEFSTGMLWGRLSDVVGRKPILLTGMAGTGLSMLMFGFAPNLKVALLARALGGILNGNIGVLQTTVAEVVPLKEHQAFAFSIMPSVWCIGSIIGSGLGGSLAEPLKNHPTWFSPDSVFAKYPFLLPNLVCISVVVLGLIVGILFLEESHEKKKHRPDFGLACGQWILNTCFGTVQAGRPGPSPADESNDEEAVQLVREEPPPAYSSNESTPRCSTTSLREEAFANSKLSFVEEVDPIKPKYSFQHIFTRQIILCIIAYGVLAYHTISFEQLLPVLLSMDRSDEAVHLPFKFTGGFQFSSNTVGYILSFQGVYQIPAQLIIFPRVVKAFGPLMTFRFVAISYAFLYLVTPYLTIMPQSIRWPALFLVLMWKVTYQAMAYPCINLLLANSAPSTLVLGAINGAAASTASLARAFGPTISGLIQSAGLSIGCLGLAWWAAGTVAGLGAVECLFIETPFSLSEQNKTTEKLGELPRAGCDGSLDQEEVDDDVAERRSLNSIRSSASEETLVDEGPAIRFPTLVNKEQV